MRNRTEKPRQEGKIKQNHKGHNRTKDRIRIGCGSVDGAFASDTRDSRF